jgi:hypothetical protein
MEMHRDGLSGASINMRWSKIMKPVETNASDYDFEHDTKAVSDICARFSRILNENIQLRAIVSALLSKNGKDIVITDEEFMESMDVEMFYYRNEYTRETTITRRGGTCRVKI